MRCPNCNGNSFVDGETCPECEGTGHVGKDAIPDINDYQSGDLEYGPYDDYKY